MSQLRKTIDKESPPLLVLGAGLIAGTTEVIITYPLDTIKTHMQINSNINIFNTARNIVNKSGFIGLYYGIIPSITQVAGKASIRFTLYEQIRHKLKGDNSGISNSINLIAGLLSGAVEAIIWTSPTERIKILQQDSKKYIPTKMMIANIIKTDGIHGLYKGTVPTIYKQSLSVGSRFWLYNIIKDHFQKDGGKINSYQTLFTGFIAGGLSTTFNHPFDVVKSHIQSNKNQGGTFVIMKDIFKTNGIKGLFSGLTPRFYRVGLAQSITFLIYESIFEFYKKHNH